MSDAMTGQERYKRLGDEAKAALAAMPPDERRALYAAWEAQRPLMELAVTTPPDRFINCWRAARDFALERDA